MYVLVPAASSPTGGALLTQPPRALLELPPRRVLRHRRPVRLLLRRSEPDLPHGDGLLGQHGRGAGRVDGDLVLTAPLSAGGDS